MLVLLFAAIAMPLRMTVREMMRDHETDPTLSDIARRSVKMQQEKTITEQSLERARTKWPKAFVQGDPFHDAVLKRKKELEAAHSSTLEDPLWPEVLCAVVAGELRIQPVITGE